MPLVPIFLIFLATHIFVILYGLFTHLSQMGTLARAVQSDVHGAVGTLGFWGMIFLVLRSYSMGAGTYTGHRGGQQRHAGAARAARCRRPV